MVARTPCGRLAQIADIVDAMDFLLRNPAVNGVSLNLDGDTSRLGPGLALPGHCSAAEGIDCSQTTPGPDSTAQG